MENTVFFGKKALLVACVALSLTGCKQILSNVLVGPDEMAVVDSAPLTLPPSFELRPPRPGQTNDVTADDVQAKAEALIIGESVEEVSAKPQAAIADTQLKTDEDWFFDEMTKSEADAQDASSKAVEKTVHDIPEKGFFQRTFSKKN